MSIEVLTRPLNALLSGGIKVASIVVVLALAPYPVMADHGRLNKLEDLNDDPDVVEVELVAKESLVTYRGEIPTQVYTYNGSIPGPLIKGKVGDTLIVHFYNELPEETTVHWHGVELPANMDGANIAQRAVPPGGYFRYEFKLLRPSLYWFHPHIRGNEQVERGLYGTLLVEDEYETKKLKLPKKQMVLVLDDIELDESGKITEAFPADPLLNAAVQVNGREGNHLLVNGAIEPDFKLTRGKAYRLRLVNTSNSRFMRIDIAGQRLWRIGGDSGLLEAPIEVAPIGQVPVPGDHMDGMDMDGMNTGVGMGAGGMAPNMDDGDASHSMMSDPDPDKGVILTPGERADIVFVPTGDEDQLVMKWHDFPRGRHSTAYNDAGKIMLGHLHNDGQQPPKTLATFTLKGKKKGHQKKADVKYWEPPASLREIAAVDVSNAETLPVTMGHSMPDAEGNVTFFVTMIDGVPYPFERVTAELAPKATTGETRIIEIANMTGGFHNFHIHGFVFQLIETQFVDMDDPENNYTVPAPYLEEKDTIILPGRPGAMGRSRSITRLAMHLDDTGREGQIVAFGKSPSDRHSGGWLYHCHILEHADRGMASFLQIMN